MNRIKSSAQCLDSGTIGSTAPGWLWSGRSCSSSCSRFDWASVALDLRWLLHRLGDDDDRAIRLPAAQALGHEAKTETSDEPCMGSTPSGNLPGAQNFRAHADNDSDVRRAWQRFAHRFVPTTFRLRASQFTSWARSRCPRRPRFALLLRPRRACLSTTSRSRSHASYPRIVICSQLGLVNPGAQDAELRVAPL